MFQRWIPVHIYTHILRTTLTIACDRFNNILSCPNNIGGATMMCSRERTAVGTQRGADEIHTNTYTRAVYMRVYRTVMATRLSRDKLTLQWQSTSCARSESGPKLPYPQGFPPPAPSVLPVTCRAAWTNAIMYARVGDGSRAAQVGRKPDTINHTYNPRHHVTSTGVAGGECRHFLAVIKRRSYPAFTLSCYCVCVWNILCTLGS